VTSESAELTLAYETDLFGLETGRMTRWGEAGPDDSPHLRAVKRAKRS